MLSCLQSLTQGGCENSDNYFLSRNLIEQGTEDNIILFFSSNTVTFKNILLCLRTQMDNILLYIGLNHLSRYSTARHVLNQKNEAFDYVINRLLLMSPYLIECADIDSST